MKILFFKCSFSIILAVISAQEDEKANVFAQRITKMLSPRNKALLKRGDELLSINLINAKKTCLNIKVIFLDKTVLHSK